MAYYHPAWNSNHQHHFRHGFLSMASLHKLDDPYGRSPRSRDTACRTLACTSYEAAVEYGKAAYGGIDIVIIEIDGEYETSPLSGTLVPKGTVFLYGEIPADRVRLAEPEVPHVSASVLGPKF